MRTNIYKDKIIKLFRKNHLLSIANIHKKIIGVDYSTVYRNIEQLVSDKEIKKIVLDKDNIVYEINKKSDHHDHFLCTECGVVEEVRVSPKKLSLSTSYKISDFLVRGLCKGCNQ